MLRGQQVFGFAGTCSGRAQSGSRALEQLMTGFEAPKQPDMLITLGSLDSHPPFKRTSHADGQEAPVLARSRAISAVQAGKEGLYPNRLRVRV
jgi:hypothetical protein